ncbi:MBL fold metallo-hydrolase [Alicyclobacillus cellulosilyticus]|uniref:MBL fold metallo-hydrolase n=1 Tax=Alicyclobacillus cellulosilyticus TaxID=1003997 RepID=A0A917K4I7_9BACL|nr:MBL fold metallo-hydrolase [Alicyclobacillus cellulosilyticus]GGI97659.1 MBL fold metallo-hydrolase [Alicyclobacillus cellulosilyticus]
MEPLPGPVRVEPYGQGVYGIDLYEQGQPHRTWAYLILDERPALIETGSARAHDILLASLAALGVQPADLAYVIVTHVHLDHAGGAGQFMRLAPQARLVVHPRGARHMQDPSRLWAGAEAVYGPAATARLFGSIQPVPADQVLVRQHGETLHLGARTLTFFDSPGHARHHFTILDPVSDALFAGDALGIRYRREYTGWAFDLTLPSTSPVDFDPDQVSQTAAMLAAQPFTWVFHTHGGRAGREEALAETERIAWAWAGLVSRQDAGMWTEDELEDALRAWIHEDLAARGLAAHDLDLSPLAFDLMLNAKGLLHYLRRRETDRTADTSPPLGR